MNPNYEAPAFETRTIFGLKLEQLRNNGKVEKALFQNIKSKRKDVRYLSNLYYQVCTISLLGPKEQVDSLVCYYFLLFNNNCLLMSK